MVQRTLNIGRWVVEFYFCPDGYDVDAIFERLYDSGAGVDTINRAFDLMESGAMNTGFTFSNPFDKVALVAIGPTTSSDEFIDTLVHELHHLAVAIAQSVGVDLESETPAYISGDSARALAKLICQMGCGHSK